LTDNWTTPSPQSTDRLAQDLRIAALEGDPTSAELTERARYFAHQRASRTVRDTRAVIEAAREAVAEADARQRDAVREALATGLLAVVEVAEVLGVSRAQVYQIRDGRR